MQLDADHAFDNSGDNSSFGETTNQYVIEDGVEEEETAPTCRQEEEEESR